MYLFCISCKYIVATIKVPTLVETRVFGEYFLKRSVQRICYKYLKKHIIKVDLNCLDPGNVNLNNLNAPVLNVLKNADPLFCGYRNISLSTIVSKFIRPFSQ